MQYVAENKEWIFSGAGAVVVAAILTAIARRLSRNNDPGHNNQMQKSGSFSTNTQIGSVTDRQEEDKK
ncbi:hypothetical protein [Ensifer sp. 1H6]|uniref:hypothetical protein n=1 Tax=Ensifer sp. 1H6 TaxID=1911585 RepID=UPI000FE1D27E|nr:hypothetical protein [Ensifer sp. 1H6]